MVGGKRRTGGGWEQEEEDGGMEVGKARWGKRRRQGTVTGMGRKQHGNDGIASPLLFVLTIRAVALMIERPPVANKCPRPLPDLLAAGCTKRDGPPQCRTVCVDDIGGSLQDLGPGALTVS